MRDCCFLVADQAMVTAFKMILTRADRASCLGTGPFDFDPDRDLIQVAGYTDGGVFKHGHRILSPKRQTHTHAVVCLDRKAKGSPPRGQILSGITGNLRRDGWSPDHVAVVVIDPEVEQWLWMDHPACEQAFKYDREKHGRSMRDMMAEQGKWLPGHPKPHDHDAALGWIAHRNRRGIAPAAAFRKMLPTAPIQDCVDDAFKDLRSALQRWFPAPP